MPDNRKLLERLFLKMSLIGIYIFITILIGHDVKGQDGLNHDPCVDKEYNNFFQAMNARFPYMAKFTGTIPAPPVLYDNLFNQSFTKDTFRDYSQEYASKRVGLHNCKESDYKRMSIYGFDFADFIFIQRASDFADRLPCIQRSINTLPSSYKSDCRNYLGSSQSSDASLCQFQNCTSMCNVGSIQKSCGIESVNLYRLTLFKAYEIVRNYLEPIEVRPQIDSGLQRSPLPKQCRRLALLSVTDSSAETIVISMTCIIMMIFIHITVILAFWY